MTTQLAPRVKRCTIAAAIREGVVIAARREAEVGGTIFAPSPSWSPQAGPHALTALTVAQVEPSHVLAYDAKGEAWVIWR